MNSTFRSLLLYALAYRLRFMVGGFTGVTTLEPGVDSLSSAMKWSLQDGMLSMSARLDSVCTQSSELHELQVRHERARATGH